MSGSRGQEWLETDGLGGFASGTVSGLRTRRYHGLLITATTPPTGRMMLVSGADVTIETASGCFFLSTQRYAPDTVGGDGEQRVEHFGLEPWPTWIFRLPDGTRVAHELFMRPGVPQVFLSWRLLTGSPGSTALNVRPFLAVRDLHGLTQENPAFVFEPQRRDVGLRFQPYAGAPAVAVSSSGVYRHEPCWYRRFVYEEERRRGLDFEEDLGSPGVFRFDLALGEAALVFGADRLDPPALPARAAMEQARASERGRRARLGGPLGRAADQYLVARRGGQSLIAGYPWFGDWGRDTFIALRGLCLATGRVAQAVEILSAWAGVVSEGMLPNFFPDGHGPPEFNSVDASLWYVNAVAEAIPAAGPSLGGGQRRRLVDAVEAIVAGYARGTRYGIRGTEDGLLAAGVAGQQLTWMDARVGSHVITPRIGKPVEVQALWLNALSSAVALGAPSRARFSELLARGRASFERRFWDEAHGRLFDVVDVDHRAGAVDASLRPNQILAVGGLPLALLEGERARRVLATVEAALLTPLGLRSLGPDEPGYRPRYQGGVEERDGAYHQGTVWPWLLGPFVEAYVRVHAGSVEAKRSARERFVTPLLVHLHDAGLGHVSEVADAEAPFTPGGCPFQAWSLGELVRLDRVVLAEGRNGATVAA